MRTVIAVIIAIGCGLLACADGSAAIAVAESPDPPPARPGRHRRPKY